MCSNNIYPRNPSDYNGGKIQDTASFIRKARWVHGEDRYDYSAVVYSGNRIKVKIKCNKCFHEFIQQPDKHLYRRQGCGICGGTSKSNTSEFIEKAKALYGDRFDYTKSMYVSNRSPIKIYCKEHDCLFETKPNYFLLGHIGCEVCHRSRMTGCYSYESVLSGDSSWDTKRSTKLYHVRFTREDDTTFDKIGVTVREFNARFASTSRINIKWKIVDSIELPLQEALKTEKMILDWLHSNNQLCKVHDFQNQQVGGWTECFSSRIDINLNDFMK